MSTLEELKKNLEMIKNIKLSQQELKELSFYSSNRQNSLYCQQCCTCIPQSPNNLAIPSIMRSYMYAYGYWNMEHAQHTLHTSGIQCNPCSGCDACNVK